MTNPVVVLLAAKLRMALHAAAGIRNESKLKIAVLTVSAILLWMGAFGAFYRGFAWLRGFEVASGGHLMGVGDIIMLRLLSVFALALFLMLIFSNVLIVHSTLYRSREVAYLVQAPLTFRQLFLGRFAECVVFSSWASAYLGSPLILAYGLNAEAPWPFYAAGVAFYIPFITIPAALGAFITMTLVRIYPRLPRGALFVFVVAVVGAIFVYLRGVLSAARLAEEAVKGSRGLTAVVAVTRQTQSALLPSQWASEGLLLASAGHYWDSLFYLLLLTANALLLTWLAAEFAERVFYPGWASLGGNGRRRGQANRFSPLSLADRLLRIIPYPSRALVSKDLRLFWRDPAQWAQFAIFFGIMAVYVASLRNRSYEGYEHFQTWIASMNIGAGTLILATLTSRFVFPLISLEGRRFWILGLAPITLRQIIWQKYWLSVATTSAFTVGLVVLSCIRLGVAPVAFALAVYSIIAANFGLSGLAIGLGALYPNFQEDNPARIVSGMGGTLNFLMSMGYIALIIAGQTFILQWRALRMFQNPESFWYALAIVVAFITALSIFCALVPIWLGLRNLRRAEY